MQMKTPDIQEKMKKINTFLFDVDGVFTDGHILLMPGGQFVRSMSTRDGYAIQYLIHQGYRVGIISGGASESVKMRFEGLGVPSSHIFMQIRDKKEVFEEFLIVHQLNRAQVLYMGDDLPDYPVMKSVGVSACPKNAVQEILELSDLVSGFKGGKGCVREIIEQVLRIQNQWKIEAKITNN